MEYRMVTLECKCGVKVEVKATIWPGYSDHEMIKCPECKEYISEIRADMGYEIVEVIKPE